MGSTKKWTHSSKATFEWTVKELAPAKQLLPAAGGGGGIH